MRDHELAAVKAEKRAAWATLATLDAARLAWERGGLEDGPELVALERGCDEARATFTDARRRYVRLALGRLR